MRVIKEREDKEIKLVVKKQEKTFFIRITTDNTVDVVGFDDNEKIFDELFVMDEAKRRLGHVEEKFRDLEDDFFNIDSEEVKVEWRKSN